MISFRWLSELREFAIAPVVIATINDDAADASTMTINPFRGGVYYYIGTPFQWFEQITACAKSVINDQWQIIFFCKATNFSKSGILRRGLPIVSR